jgi:hypothetical protein
MGTAYFSAQALGASGFGGRPACSRSVKKNLASVLTFHSHAASRCRYPHKLWISVWIDRRNGV